MATFKVVLEFHYDSNEDLHEWGGHMPHQYVDTTEKALDCFYAELDTAGLGELCPVVFVQEEEGEDFKPTW